MTPLSSISTYGIDATPCPDISVAKSVSVELGTSMSVDFDDRAREIHDIVATPEIKDTPGARSSGNPSNE